MQSKDKRARVAAPSALPPLTALSALPALPALAALAALVLGAAVALPAQAADAQQLYVQSLAATCANCHGTNGKAQPDASVTGLAGLKADYLIEQMQAFKSGTRPATIMHQIAKGFNDEQVRQLADYFAGQK